jgi:diaminohydroxyphosphoribosylaminopyrimidine deaminase / 5-amino-6-(5-phosphoribosylamino)uracil reductase
MDYSKLPPDLHPLFAPLTANNSFVIGQLGQSLDGRVATPSGHSKYINGKDGLLHLHRLRAVVDAVVVGVGTVIADNPLLNTRLCVGQNPARVIIDPQGRVPKNAITLRDDGTRCIVISSSAVTRQFGSHVEQITLPNDATIDYSNKIDPQAIIEALAQLGFCKLLIEGGPKTIANFITNKALHRLHIIMAPIIIGSGKNGICLPDIELLDDAFRPKTATYMIGAEVIFDCEF